MGSSEDYLHLCHQRGSNTHVSPRIFVSLFFFFFFYQIIHVTQWSVVFFWPHRFLVSACESGCSDVYLTIWLSASERPIWLFGGESLLTPRVRVCNHVRGCVECTVQTFIGVSVNVTYVALHAPTVTPKGPRESNKMTEKLFEWFFKKKKKKFTLLPELSVAGNRAYRSLHCSFGRAEE